MRVGPSAPGPWLTRERALALALLVLTAVALYLSYRLAQPFLPALAWAIALAVVAYPFHGALARRIAAPSLAAGLAVAVVALVVLVPVTLISQRLAAEAASAIDVVESVAANLWNTLTSHLRLGPMLRWFQIRMDLPELAGRAGEVVTASSGTLLTGSIWVVTQLLVTLFLLFYLFRDHAGAERLARSLLPLSEAEATVVLERLGDTIRATVSGALGVAAIQGTLGGLIFWLLGLPSPLFWGVVMALLATIPMAGTFLVWAPAALFLALSGSWGKALILVGWGGTAIALIDNLLYPYLVGTRLRLHPVPVFIAVVGGITVYGAAGIILGPITLAVTIALIDIWRARTAEGRPAEIPAEPAAIAAVEETTLAAAEADPAPAPSPSR
ncbi:MAG: AI-2E family transporter [Candidatus Rokubacteria bacterium]|nr:AI-2E family transporter [Candidatus Rokubacteria bacterium]